VTRRLPQIAFGLLALATIGAFFLVQAVKTAPALLWAAPHPVPPNINPVEGRVCSTGAALDHRRTQITISLYRADTVGIYIVSAKNPAGNNVATISSGTPMRASPKQREYPRTFTWNGRLEDGQPAPAGNYYFRIVLEHEGRSLNIDQYPVRVIRARPHPKILSVRLLEPRPAAGTVSTATTIGSTTTTSTTATGGTTTAGNGGGLVAVPGPAVLSPPQGNGVSISYTRGSYSGVSIDIYRTDVAGSPELVDTYAVSHPDRHSTTWNGEINNEPAPAGTYLVGITAEDLACDQAQWPATIPPAAGTTADAGVTVRYLSVTPPLTPVSSGSVSSVSVDSPTVGFSWSLRRAGSAKVLAAGSGAAGSSQLRVRMPRHRAGLYSLSVASGIQGETVPLVVSQAGPAAVHASVLVVLPMLSWIGDSPVDDNGDGLPDTLRAGDAVSLTRPLVDGPPAGFGADATLLAYLTAHHLSYQLTTDVALAENVGPSLADRGGVILPEGGSVLPAALEPTLRGFVRGGGRALVLGTSELTGASELTGFPSSPRAAAPQLTLRDLFDARRGPITPTGGELISSVSADAFNLFVDAGEFRGFSQYQPIMPPAGAARTALSAIGIGSAAPAIVAFHYGSGTAIEVGLSGFASSLANNADSSSLLNNIWQLLSH
jgi:hypothetical protein